MVRAAVDDGLLVLELAGAVLVLVVLGIWCWLLILVLGDVLRRDCSGAAKASWTAFLVFFPYVGLLAYLTTQGRGMVERRRAQEAAPSGQPPEHGTAPLNGRSPGGPADQIAAAKRLLDTGAITRAEYEVLKRDALDWAAHRTSWS